MAGIGPKAASLQRLARAGLPVPEARYLPADVFAEHAERARLIDLLARYSGASLDAAAVRRAIEVELMDEGTAERLEGWHADLGGGSLAVRSSGTAEDLPDASFAGQHGTWFVHDSDELIERVRDCWASLFSDRAVAYRESRGIAHSGLGMAVIVQRLVPADAAGVAFTANPADGSDDVVVEACLGIGEALVSGKVTPDRFVFSRGSLACRSVVPGDKRVRVIQGPDGTVVERAVPPEDAAALSVDEATARRVAGMALQAEEVFGQPVDVEWASEAGRLWLLQARPITAVQVAGPVGEAGAAGVAAAEAGAVGVGPMVAPEGPPTIWSNVNTGEILPDVATPMTWSIIRGHADDILGGMFGAFGTPIDSERIIGLVGGRIYFNLTLLRETFRTIPGVDPDIALGGLHGLADLPRFDDTPVPLAARLRAGLRLAVAMPGYVARHAPSKAAPFAARMRSTTEAALREIDAAASDPEASFRILLSLDGRFKGFNEALAFMAVAMFGFGALGGLTGRWLGDRTGALANRLVAGRGDVASAQAGHALWRLSATARAAAAVRGAVLLGAGWADVRERLEAASAAGDEHASVFLSAWDAFMREHGHHRRGELEFGNPTWSETPDYVLGIVRSYLVDDRGSDPLVAYAERSADADTAAAEATRRLPWPKRAVFSRVLGWGRASAHTRESIKSEAVRWLASIRGALLALAGGLVEGGALDDVDDIFYLEWGELPALVAGEHRDWRGLVAARRREHARLRELSPPPVVVGTWDEASGPWAVDPSVRTLTGISVSAGVARGPARVFLTVDAEEPVLPGEILVAPFTDPGWTPYFVPAAGIVMDMGGLLSHGSIIAREYGIPAVVNVGPATRVISTGQLIEVDGDAGVVRILG